MYRPYKSFFLLNSLPFTVSLPGSPENPGLSAGLGVIAVDDPGIYTLAFESPETTNIRLISLERPYPAIHKLNKGEELKLRVKLSEGEKALFLLLSSSQDEKATLRILSPKGHEITPKSANRTEHQLLAVPFIAPSAGEYILVLRAETKGSFILLTESLSKALEAK
jgi:hypothetical protein